MRKNTPNKIAALCLSLTLLMAGGVSGAVSAGAADGEPDITITYDGSTRIQSSPADDFFGDAGKNLMPGSSFTKSMDIVNQSNDTLLVYLRAEVGEEVYAEYLQTHPEEALSEAAYAEQLIKELTLTITALDRQGNPVEVYYQGPASGDPQHQHPTSDSAGLTARYPNTEHGIVIGRLSDNAVASLTFEVGVPLSLGNEYQDTMSVVKWVLICDATPPEEIPDESTPLTPPPSSGENIDDEDVPLIDGPKTGVDSSASHLVAITVVAGAALLLFLLLLLKKREDKKKASATQSPSV